MTIPIPCVLGFFLPSLKLTGISPLKNGAWEDDPALFWGNLAPSGTSRDQNRRP